MKYLILFVCLASLQGCMSPEQRAWAKAARAGDLVGFDTPLTPLQKLGEAARACQADPDCKRRLEAQQAEAEARIARDNADFDARMAAIHQRTEDVHSVSDSIVANAAARNARDTAAVTAATPSPAQVPQQPTRQADPLAPNSAMQAEAAQARKGTGTDLCPNEISDIECANRLQWLQEQARGQH